MNVKDLHQDIQKQFQPPRYLKQWQGNVISIQILADEAIKRTYYNSASIITLFDRSSNF
jgi:hypothetical protein